MKIDPRENIALENPLKPDQQFLRNSLVPNMLEVVQRNIASGLSDMRFFELGRTFRFVRGKPYAHEPLMLAAVEVSGTGRASTKPDVAPEWQHLAQILESV